MPLSKSVFMQSPRFGNEPFIMHFTDDKSNGQNETTLTDISEYLTKHDGTLERSLNSAKFELRGLKTDVADLKADFSRTFKTKDAKSFAAKFDPI